MRLPRDSKGRFKKRGSKSKKSKSKKVYVLHTAHGIVHAVRHRRSGR